MGRLVPTNATFYVNSTGGTDYTNFGLNASNPIKTSDWLECLQMAAGDTVAYVGASQSNSNTSPNILSIATETFDNPNTATWDFNLYANGGKITQGTSNPAPFQGKGYANMYYPGAPISYTYMDLKNVTAANIVQGNTLYTTYWIYFPNDASSAGDLFWRAYDNSASLYETRFTRFGAGADFVANELVFTCPRGSARIIPAGKSLTTGAWHRIDTQVYYDPAAGWFKTYVDGVLWFFLPGWQTITAGSYQQYHLAAMNFFLYTNPVNIYVDDFSWGKALLY